MRTTLNVGFRKLFAVLALTCCCPIFAQNYSELTANEQLSEDILREIIGIETTERKPEENLRALEAMAQRLRAAGFPEDDIEIVNPSGLNLPNPAWASVVIKLLTIATAISPNKKFFIFFP